MSLGWVRGVVLRTTRSESWRAGGVGRLLSDARREDIFRIDHIFAFVRVDRRDEGPTPFVPLVIALELLIMSDITFDAPLEVFRRRSDCSRRLLWWRRLTKQTREVGRGQTSRASETERTSEAGLVTLFQTIARQLSNNAGPGIITTFSHAGPPQKSRGKSRDRDVITRFPASCCCCLLRFSVEEEYASIDNTVCVDGFR